MLWIVHGYDAGTDECAGGDTHTPRDMAGGLNRNAASDPAVTDVAMRPDGAVTPDTRPGMDQCKWSDAGAAPDANILLDLGQRQVVETHAGKWA